MSHSFVHGAARLPMLRLRLPMLGLCTGLGLAACSGGSSDALSNPLGSAEAGSGGGDAGSEGADPVTPDPGSEPVDSGANSSTDAPDGTSGPGDAAPEDTQAAGDGGVGFPRIR